MTKLHVLFSIAVFVATFAQLAFARPMPRHNAGLSLDGLTGFATENGGTTGGSGGPVVIVNTVAAFTKAVKDDNPRIIKLNGMFKISGQIDVGSNKTILGANSNSGFTGGGLRVKGKQNVIIRNLKISFAKGTDAITLQKSTNVWIDHNELWSDLSHGKDYYDGLLDITHACDYITVSWNDFHDHWKVSLVGHSDTNGEEDTGHLHVTYHHNYIHNVGSRTPSVRFGTVHVYNNFYEKMDTSVHSRMGADVLVEGNVWRDVKVSITTTGDSKQDGRAVQRDDDFGGAKYDITETCPFEKAPYKFSLDALNKVESIVTVGAGVGIY